MKIVYPMCVVNIKYGDSEAFLVKDEAELGIMLSDAMKVVINSDYNRMPLLDMFPVLNEEGEKYSKFYKTLNEYSMSEYGYSFDELSNLSDVQSRNFYMGYGYNSHSKFLKDIETRFNQTFSENASLRNAKIQKKVLTAFYEDDANVLTTLVEKFNEYFVDESVQLMNFSKIKGIK